MRRFNIILALASALLLGSAVPASAQSTGLTGGTSVSKEPPRFYGLTLGFSAWYATGLNIHNYQGNLGMLIEPTWNFGKLLFRESRAGGMHIAFRISLNRQLWGTDESQISAFGDDSGTFRCYGTGAVPTGNGTINPNDIGYCSVARNHRMGYGDIWATLRAPGLIPKIPKLEIGISPTFRVIIPVSAESQFATMRAGITPGLTLSRGFLGGKISAAYILLFNKFFYQYDTPGFEVNGRPIDTSRVAYTPSMESFLSDPSRIGAGQFNTNYSVTQLFNIGYQPLEKLGFSFIYILTDGFGFAAPETTITRNDIGMHDVGAATQRVCEYQGKACPDVGPRRLHGVWIAASYDPLDWLNISLSWITFAPRLKPDGSYRQPFIGTNHDALTSINIGVGVSIDGVAKKIFKKPL